MLDSGLEEEKRLKLRERYIVLQVDQLLQSALRSIDIY